MRVYDGELKRCPKCCGSGVVAQGTGTPPCDVCDGVGFYAVREPFFAPTERVPSFRTDYTPPAVPWTVGKPNAGSDPNLLDHKADLAYFKNAIKETT